VIAIEVREGGTPVIVNRNEVECDSEPPVPVIVMVAFPTGAESPAVIVSVDDPEPPAIVASANCAVTPDGVPAAERVTPEEKPPSAVELTMGVALEPLGMVMVGGVTDSTKSGTGTPLMV
jgi:hypothetical protein